MKTLKKVWLTEQSMFTWALSLESESLKSHEKLNVKQMEFPAKEPTRHTAALTYLGIEDLAMLHKEIGEVLHNAYLTAR